MTDPTLAAMAKPAVRLPNLRPSEPAPPRAVRPAPEPDPATEAERSASEARPARSRARKGGRPASGRQSVQIGLPAALAEAMAAAAQRAGQAYGDWLMQAANDVWDRLGEVYPPLPKVRPGWPEPRRTPRGELPGGRTVKNFRLTPPDRKSVV